MPKLTDIEKIAIRLSKITALSTGSWMQDLSIITAYFGSEFWSVFVAIDDDELHKRIKIGLLATEYPKMFNISKVRELFDG